MPYASYKKIIPAQMDSEFQKIREAGGTIKEIIFLNGTIRTVWAMPTLQ
jgi:hypothetical protein